MAKGLVAPRSAPLLSKSVRYHECYPDAGGRVPNEGPRPGRRVVEAGQRDPAEGDVHREEGSQMEHASRIPAESLESQKLAHPDEHAGRKGRVPFASSTCRTPRVTSSATDNYPSDFACTHLPVLPVARTIADTVQEQEDRRHQGDIQKWLRREDQREKRGDPLRGCCQHSAVTPDFRHRARRSVGEAQGER